MNAPDVAVVGGGIIGLSIAWRAATGHGLDVAVIDDAPGQGATGVAAGMLAPVTEVHFGEEPLLALNVESAHRWPSFAAELQAASGVGVGYRDDGTLSVAFDDDDLRALDQLCRFQAGLGLPVERLDRRQCRQREPLLSPRARGGVLAAGDHQVDPRRVAAALIEACHRAGVGFVADRATALEGAGRVCLARGDEVDAGTVVVAAGSWSGLLPGATVPVRPVKGQLLRLRFDPAGPPLTATVRGLVAGRAVYLVPRCDGELVIGATVEEQGFTTSVTAGAVRELLQAASDLVPAVGELELVEMSAGLRPATPDNGPLIGTLPGNDRVVVATGHYRNGVLLAPVTADAVAGLLGGAPLPAVAAAFSVSRFAS